MKAVSVVAAVRQIKGPCTLVARRTLCRMPSSSSVQGWSKLAELDSGDRSRL